MMRRIGTALLLLGLTLALVGATTLKRGPGGGSATPGLSGAFGNDATLSYLYDLRSFECLPTFNETYYFDPIKGLDANDGLSMAAAFRTMSKANDVCTDPRVECVLKSGGAWSPHGFALTSISGQFNKGDIVTFADGSALLLDYDAGEAFGIFEMVPHPQPIHNDASSGTFTLTLLGAVTSAIAFNASAATVAAAIEALPNVFDVTVTGAGTAGSPWVVTFVDPARPPFALLGNGSGLVGGTLTVATPVLAGGDTITSPSGATATISGSAVNLANARLTFASAECDADELCNLIRASGDEPVYISGSLGTIGGGGVLFDATAHSGWVALEGITPQRTHQTNIAAGKVVLLDVHAPEMTQLTAGGQAFFAVGTDMWALNTSASQILQAAGDNTGDMIGSDGTYVGRGTFGKARGNPRSGVNNGNSPIGVGGGLVVGHTINGSEMSEGATDGKVHLWETGPGAAPTFVDVLFRGDPAGSVSNVLGPASATAGTITVNMQGVTVADLQGFIDFRAGGVGTFLNLTADSLVVDQLVTGGKFIAFDDAAALQGSTVNITNWIHDDTGQVDDWTTPTADHDTITAFLADSDVAAGDWAIPTATQSTSPQWSTPYACDPTKECWEANPRTISVTFPTPLPAFVTSSCVEITGLSLARENIGAR